MMGTSGVQFNRHLEFKACVKAKLKARVKNLFRKASDRVTVNAWVKAVQNVYWIAPLSILLNNPLRETDLTGLQFHAWNVDPAQEYGNKGDVDDSFRISQNAICITGRHLHIP